MDKELWRRIGVRVALVVSLCAAAFGGAFLAIQMRPSDHASAALRVPGRNKAVATASPAATAVDTAVPVLTVVPERAMLSVDSGPAVRYGSWIRSLSPSLRVTLPTSKVSAPLQVEVEVAPAGHPFDGSVSVKSAPLRVSQTAPTTVTVALSGLDDGLLYHWHVRTKNAGGITSAWVGGGLFGVSVTAPSAPRLATTNVTLGSWSRARSALFRWTDSGSRVPVSYYQYALVHGAPPPLDQVHWQRARGSVLAVSGLVQGYWRVFARAVDLAGNVSPPVKWGFGVADQGAPAPKIVSADPAQGSRADSATPSLAWRALRGAAPVVAYEYTVVPSSSSATGAVWVLTTQANLSLPGLTDGAWTVYVRSVDAAGNRSSALRWSFTIDRVAPAISQLQLSAGSFTPPIEKLRLSYSLTKTAVVSYTIALSGTGAPIASGSLGRQVAGKHVAFTWNGMLGGRRLAAGGQYVFSLEAVDAAGNHSKIARAEASLLDKRIIVSISKEELWAYQGNSLIVHTLVTNGGPDTPTIPGVFHILGKYPDWVFHSPWPKGSPLWYPDSPTSFALLYQATGGYFLHDAPWRSNYGPGSNSLAGTPGGSYTGTHGCTNVPYDAMKTIYNWADVGTVVQIVK